MAMAYRFAGIFPFLKETTAILQAGLVLLAGVAMPASASAQVAASIASLDAAAPGDFAGQAQPAANLPPILVEGSRSGDANASLAGFSAAPLLATPLSIDVISADDLLERGVNSLSSAIRTDPSVGDNYNTFGYIEALQIRGFTLNELLNYQRDGMTVSSHVPVALENKESIEILKGTSGMLAGSSSPGGLVNYVLKKPTAQTLAQVDISESERGSVLVHGDFGGHLDGPLPIGYRINLVAEDRQPVINSAWSKRTLLSGFFDWHAAPDTLLQVEFEHQLVRETSVPGYALLDSTNSGMATTLPPPIDPRNNLNAQPWTQPFQSSATDASVRLQQRLGANWDLQVQLATQRSTTNDRIAFPDGCSHIDANTPSGYYVYNGMCSNYNVDLYQYISNNEVRNTNSTDTHLHGRLQLGGVGQEITIGAKTTRYSERYPQFQTYNYVGTVNALAPVAVPANPTAANPNAPLDTDLDELYAFDVAHFARVWSLWAGARYTRIAQDSSLTDGSQATSLQQHLVTPWLGVGLEPWTGGFAYASAGSGVEVGNVPNHPAYVYTGQQLSFANAGQALPAQRSRQVELGFKQRAGAAWSFDAALFRITKPFADNVPLPNGEALQVAGARAERHQGLELSGAWQALASLDLRAAATLMDARTIAAVNPGWIGKAPTNVAPLAVSLQDNWTPAALPGFAWSNLWTYAGHKTVLPDGSVDLPSYWQWDTGLHYARTIDGLHWIWRGGVDNLTGRSYWREAPMPSWGSIYLFPAAARVFRVGASLSW